jgi:hypothetical protein
MHSGCKPLRILVTTPNGFVTGMRHTDSRRSPQPLSTCYRLSARRKVLRWRRQESRDACWVLVPVVAKDTMGASRSHRSGRPHALRGEEPGQKTYHRGPNGNRQAEGRSARETCRGYLPQGLGKTLIVFLTRQQVWSVARRAHLARKGGGLGVSWLLSGLCVKDNNGTRPSPEKESPN